MTGRPQLWVFAGPNGSRRSTLVERFHVGDRIKVVNPDTIARQLAIDLGNKSPLMMRAGRIATFERRALIQSGQSFAMETTITGHGQLRIMARAQAAGYKLTLIFVGLDDALVSLARVRERVAQGGHDVPTYIILRRYTRSLANLPVAIERADRCFVLDNTGSRFRLLITIDEGRVRHRSRHLPVWLRQAIPTSLATDC